MKSGSTYIIVSEVKDLDISLVDSAVFTIKSASTLISKKYPDEVSYSGGYFSIPLTQENTVALYSDESDMVFAEGQINFTSKSVLKTDIQTFTMDYTLATEIIEGNTPSIVSIAKLTFSVVGDVIVAKVSGGGGTGAVDDVTVNGKSVVDDDGVAVVVVPTKTSDITNDSGFITEDYHDSAKQDVIPDLATIRSGASLGATALQSVPSEYAKMTDVEAKGYQTASEVDSAITSKGYTTMTLVEAKGYQTETEVNALIESAIGGAIDGEY